MAGVIDVIWVLIILFTFCGILFGLALMNYQLVKENPSGWSTDRIVRRKAQLRESSRSAWPVLLFGILIELGAWALTTYPRPVGDAPVMFNMAGAAIAGAAAIGGNMLGFLFGIPRTLTTESSAPPDPAVPAPQRDRTHYMVNTNLEQISDWLTKILVGLGLTQLAQIPENLRNLAAYCASALGGPPEAAEPVIAFSVIYFVLCGFFFGYLWTRLFISNALRAADDDLERAQELHAVRQRQHRAVPVPGPDAPEPDAPEPVVAHA